MPNYKKGYVPPIGEYNSGYSQTESAGYRTAKQQIESFLIAGAALKAAREGSYDSEDFDPVEDPSLSVRDYELSEIGQVISRNSFVETPKGVDKGETGVSVSPSEQSSVEDVQSPAEA